MLRFFISLFPAVLCIVKFPKGSKILFMTSYIHYLLYAFAALTHKKIALVILAVAEPTHTTSIEGIIRIAVLIITGIGALIRTYLDWTARKKK